MYRVWFQDLEKALKVFQEKVRCDMFYSIQGNAWGDFVFYIDELDTYIVKHDDFTVWKAIRDGVCTQWEEIK